MREMDTKGVQGSLIPLSDIVAALVAEASSRRHPDQIRNIRILCKELTGSATFTLSEIRRILDENS